MPPYYTLYHYMLYHYRPHYYSSTCFLPPATCYHNRTCCLLPANCRLPLATTCRTRATYLRPTYLRTYVLTYLRLTHERTNAHTYVPTYCAPPLPRKARFDKCIATYGCSRHHIRLQPPSHMATGVLRQVCLLGEAVPQGRRLRSRAGDRLRACLGPQCDQPAREERHATLV